jgi:hypothetical protein
MSRPHTTTINTMSYSQCRQSKERLVHGFPLRPCRATYASRPRRAHDGYNRLFRSILYSFFFLRVDTPTGRSKGASRGHKGGENESLLHHHGQYRGLAVAACWWKRGELKIGEARASFLSVGGVELFATEGGRTVDYVSELT